MKAAWPVSAAVTLLLSSGPAQRSEQTPITHATPAGSSLQITLAIDAHDARLIDAEPVDHAIPPRFLQAPRLSGPEAAGLPAGTREIVAAIYTADGHRAALYGWPAKGLEFYDEPDPKEEGRMTGRVSYPLDNERIIGFPLPPGATWLLLLTATLEDPRHPGAVSGAPPAESKGTPRFPVWTVPVHGPGRLRIVLRPFSALRVGPPPAGFKGGKITLDWLFPGFYLLKINSGMFEVVPVFRWCPPGNGYFDSIDRLYGTGGPPSQRFNVVILGDGFDATEMGTLDTWAAQVKEAFVSTEPFMSLQSKIDIHLIRMVSGVSGVSYCPDTVARASYFGVEGRWLTPDGTPGGPQYLGTHRLCRVREAVERLAPYVDVEVVVMIANCDLYGGRAEPDNKLAFLPINSSNPPYFRGLVLHESGHALERLGEEYVACADYDPSRTYPNDFPNIVPKALSANAWWKPLLLNTERTASGDFLAVHDFGDNIDQGNLLCEYCFPRLTGNLPPTMLGLYWGAQYGTENQPRAAKECPNNCYPFGAASPDYYRPMARCKMRWIECDFCRACEKRISDGIHIAAPP